MSDSDYSDDSDYEDLSTYHTTSVSLGFADKKIALDEKCSPLINRLGGFPIWFSETSVPSKELTHCSNCKKAMALLAQISAPLEGTYYDRVLYILSCLEPGCRRKDGSVKAIRGIKRDERKEALKKQQEEDQIRAKEEAAAEKKRKDDEKLKKMHGIGDKLISDDGTTNPFNSNPFDSRPFVDQSKQPEIQEKVKTDRKSKGKDDMGDKKDVNNMKEYRGIAYTSYSPFPCFLVQVESELLTPRDQPLDNFNVDFEEAGDDFDINTSSNNSMGMTENELAAKQLESANLDKAFQHFIEIIENNPEQVIRYDRPLKPLLYSASDKIAKILSDDGKIPRCPLSGGVRNLELQLIPHAIAVLEEGHEDIESGMEWGSIFVATCKSDAMPELNEEGIGYAEEWVGVQWEEEIDLQQ